MGGEGGAGGGNKGGGGFRGGDDGTRGGTPGWRLQRRLDAHGLSAATLSVVRSNEPELAVSEHLAGHEGSLVLRGTSAGGHDGGPLLDRVAETIMRQLAHPLLLLGPRQVNPRRDDQLSPITVRDGVSELASLLSATESWTETFTNTHAELVDVLPPDPWPRTDVDNPRPARSRSRARTSPSFERSTSVPPSCRISTVAMTPSSWSPVHDGPRRRRTGGPRPGRLVRHLPCPVLVVPSPRPARRDGPAHTGRPPRDDPTDRSPSRRGIRSERHGPANPRRGSRRGAARERPLVAPSSGSAG